jgi:cobalt-zinc-cadmium resistance protein CzcA
MSLGALDFGLIVDGAVIIVEAVMHRLYHSARFRNVTQLTQGEMNTEVKTSASRMMNSAVFGQVIILIVYLPILTLQGIEGKMFKPMAQTVAFALIGAFLLSLTYIPMMSSLVLSKKISHKPTFSDRMMERLGRGFHKILSKAIGFPKVVIGTSLGLFIIALVIMSSLGGEFIPQLEEGDFAADTRVLTGSNLHTTIEGTQKASAILLDRFPEIEKIVTKIGSGEIPTDPMPMEASDLMIILKPKKEWTSAKTFPELADKMSAAITEVPGVTTGFQYPVQMRFNELMTGAKQDVVCKIFGEDLDTLAHYAERLGKLASSIDGARDIYVETVTGLPQIVIEYNRAAIAAHGLDIETINNVVNTAFGGQSTGMLFERERRFDIVVRLAGDEQKNLNDVADLLIPTPAGAQVPLSQLATVAIKDGPNQIQREDAKRRIIVGFNVRGRDVQTIVHELQQKAEQINLPPGYYITYGGAFENLQAAMGRLSIVVPLALGLIFLMLYFAFGSVKHGLIIYSAIPLSAIGGIFALALRGMPFSISAGVGFIALFGVAVLNGIVLIAEFRKLKAAGMTDLKDIVLQGTKERLRPVLMTASVASLGFLPMALSHGAGAEVQRPLATVVIGGLITATFLTLFLLPVLFVLFEKIKWRMKPRTTILMLLLVAPALSYAQQAITLEAAIDTALHNNLQIKSQKYTTEYYRKMTGSAWDIGKTSVAAEWGNINSAYNDTRYSVTQTISFPLVYAKQHELMRDEWRASEIQLQSKKKELVKQVTLLYSEINILLQKKMLLQYADSIYDEFYKKAELRYNLGASDILEKATAENQRGQIYLQLQQLQADIEVLQARFAYLLQTDVIYQPQSEALKLPSPALAAVAPATHPDIQYLQQQQKIAVTQHQLEKTRLLPEITGGYFNQSYSGWQKVGSVEQYYTQTNRFSSGLVGISVPIAFFSQGARLKALSMNRKAAELMYKDGERAFVARYGQWLAQYRKNAAAVSYYEKTGLKNAKDILDAARDKFKQGDISYLEYTILINQSVGISTGYFDALKALNETITELNYLANK